MPYAILISYSRRGSERVWDPIEGLIYEDGREAGAYVKSENAYAEACGTSRRCKAIKIGEDDPMLWRQRIERQLTDGELARVPWHDYYYNRGQCSTGMYEHIDPDDPTKVRFIASTTDGMQDRFTSMTPGRFLRRYVDADPPNDLFDTWCASMGLELTTSPLLFAKTPDEVVWVYNNGPHSCMAYEESHPIFAHLGGRHPCEVYGNSDLAVAYIIRRGEITARALCWPDKKIHGRIYGDTVRLLERLKENDYVENWNFLGAKIRKLQTEDGQLILPYLDCDHGVVAEGDWLVYSNRPHIIGFSPNGLPTTNRCMSCLTEGVPLEEYYDEDIHDEPQYICEGCR